ncbi:ASB2 [Branchiostoma lanceolatum]|uniref:ASB2 protein n=1 Tax=Branchiostoma lanceolatum TaxID=7740 RepID=A0A8J9ZVM9_BRALA|nr:ASB2 [Branchiostoma lanceolatum]
MAWGEPAGYQGLQSEEEQLEMVLRLSMQETERANLRAALLLSAEEAGVEAEEVLTTPEESLPGLSDQENSDEEDVMGDKGMDFTEVYEDTCSTAAVVVRLGDTNVLRGLIENDRDLEVPDNRGWRPLHEAAHADQQDCLKMLLDAGVEVNVRNYEGETALYLAAEKGHVDCMVLLLEAGADLEIPNNEEATPLLKAVEVGSREVVQLLLDRDVNVNSKFCNGWAPLHEAACQGQTDIVRLLVEHGAQLDIRDEYGRTAVFVAAQYGKLECLRILLDESSDNLVNTRTEDGASPLYLAAQEDHLDCVQLLLQRGADANMPTDTDALPVHIAAEKGNYSVLELLVPVTTQEALDQCGMSPIHSAVEGDQPECLQLLINHGFDVNCELSWTYRHSFEDRRQTPVYFAVDNNSEECVRILLEAGADPNLDEINCLLITLRHKNFNITKMLIEHGADCNSNFVINTGLFPSTIAFAYEDERLLKLVLDGGAQADTCFLCSIGNGRHPVKWMTATINDTQFCEYASLHSNKQRAGTMVRLLLDYVGNVQLCSVLKDCVQDKPEWADIQKISGNPRPLVHLCRLAIRHTLAKGGHLSEKVLKLPLPQVMTRFLLHKDTAYRL